MYGPEIPPATELPTPPPVSSLLARVADPDNLYRAWEAVRAGDEADGIPSMQLLDFRHHLTERMASIAEALLGGAYIPGPLTRIDIPKRAGGMRSLRLPSIQDRVVERAIHQQVQPLVDWCLTPRSFAYRPGLGVEDAISALVGLRDEGATAVLLADFRECFDSLDRVLILDALRQALPEPWLLRLVERLLERPARWLWRWERTGKGAAQGAPLSPMLCNLYLHPFDLGMARRGFPVVRFADDFAVALAGVEEAPAALGAVEEEAAALNLEVNGDKVAISTFKEGVSFLGVEIGDEYPRSGFRAPERPAKKSLYISVQGAGTRLRHGHLQVVREKELLLSVPVSQVGQLVTFGSVGVSAQVREYALRNQIDVVFLSRRGQWLGRLDGPHPTNTRLRRRQYRRADDEEFRLGLARAIVAGKIANLRALLLRYQRRDAAPALVDTARSLEDLRRAALQAPAIPALMGIEGSASRDYFQAIALLLPEEAGFGGRNRRPPRDPANAALSFGYTLLLGEAVAGLSMAGLDPHVGFLHAEEQGRPSLALDLVEEFRPLLVDTVVLELFRRRVLTSESFRRDQEKAVYLKDGPRREFLAAFEERLLTRFAHVPSSTRTSYRRGVLLQARQLAGVILGYTDEYRPVSWR